MLDGGTDAADLYGTIELREPLGDETIYKVRLEGYHLLAKTPPRQVHRPGDRVGLQINRGRIHIFDSPGGQRLN